MKRGRRDIDEVEGVQLSAGWAVAQTAEAMTASSDENIRAAGRSLRCCEVIGLDRAPELLRERYTQGVRVWLRFYLRPDLQIVTDFRDEVATGIAQALGVAASAVQLDIDLLSNERLWIGLERPYKRGGSGLRMDRYHTAELVSRLSGRRGGIDWRQLAERPGEVKILLRRLRYRLGEDYGRASANPRYGYWTTRTTEEWAMQGAHSLQYLLYRMSHWSHDLVGADVDPAPSLDPGYWGEVDTSNDPLRVLQLTTKSGTTRRDVDAVLDHAGDQIVHLRQRTVAASAVAARSDPVGPFVEGLRALLDEPGAFNNVDVLLIHRGGGVNPDTRWGTTNVPLLRRRQLLELCLVARDRGVEVVVALGHANISVLLPGPTGSRLPLGVFEAATPTAGAAWILQEHVNPRLVDTSMIYSQPLEDPV